MHPRNINTDLIATSEALEKLFRKIAREEVAAAIAERFQTNNSNEIYYTKPEVLSSPIIKPIGLLRDVNDLKDIYENILSKNSQYILKSYPFNKFCSHFTGDGEIDPLDKIPWTESQNVLSRVIINKMMEDAKFIPYSSSPFKLICEHFVWYIKGKYQEFDPERMRKNHHNALGNVNKINAIDKIFAMFSK